MRVPVRGAFVGLDREEVLPGPQPVDVQHAVRVVGLVEHALRPEALALERELPAGDIERAHARDERPLEHSVQPAHREAAFAHLLDLGTRELDLWVHRDDPGVVDVNDHHAQRHADLLRRDADPACRHHRREHPAHEGLDLLLVDPRLSSGGMEDGIAYLTHLDRVLRDELRRRPTIAPSAIDEPRRALRDVDPRLAGLRIELVRRRRLALRMLALHARHATRGGSSGPRRRSTPLRHRRDRGARTAGLREGRSARDSFRRASRRRPAPVRGPPRRPERPPAAPPRAWWRAARR